MKKRVFFVLILALLFVLSSFSVRAVGLSSWGSIVKEIDFVPDTQQTFAYMLRTTANFAQDYELFAEGDLAHLVTFSPGSILTNVTPGQDPWFNVIINFPPSEGNITPGLHTITIGVLEGSTEGGMIGGRTSVTTRIVVRVLHPGKYLVANLDSPNVNINEPVKMNIHLENWGKQIIDSAQAKIDVFTKEGEFKETIYSNSVSIPSAGEANTYAVLDTLGYPPGDYYGEGIVTWDGQQTLINDTFKIGIQDIKINSYTATFEKNRINPFKINIESVWNSITENVYATIDLPNGQIQTPTIKLSPWQNVNLSTYWETNDIEIGKYDAKITLYFADEKKEKTVQVEVLESVEVQEQKPLGFNYLYLILIIIALIVINIFLWYYFIKKKDKGKET
ncbi:hypothetical protein KY306_00570 [Candidatus Woesearchaeota archaeon]|nr:hypothetical protein [Candidatus Woesearchaeota archaeon]